MSQILNSQIIEGIMEVDCQQVFAKMAALPGNVKLIDVRRPDEFNAELGHIDGAELITLGPDLVQYLNTENKDQEIVFVCRSGGRSGSATFESARMGFKKTMNLTGGMLAWNVLKLPIIKV
ncbi:MAG: rhodanese-like domain-containing protein [Bdellovibrionaceae bacterium]|nr:rhodanese-like domain-containing protein [Pseudobdellovibrionaceae bacterium]